MAKQGIQLVYGGGNKGIMGAVANGVLDSGGQVIGIIPQLLIDWEQAHPGLTDLRVVADMHVRKKIMYELCDAAIVLPGGFGTLDELFEMLTWNSLKIHDKQIYILDTNKFYSPLIKHMHKMYEEEFLYSTVENRITVIHEPSQLMNYL